MKWNLKTAFILILMIGGVFVFPLLSIDYFSSNNSINDVNFEFDGNQLKSSKSPKNPLICVPSSPIPRIPS